MIKNLNTIESLRLLEDNYIGRLAFIIEKNPFIIPITYFYHATEKSIISYAAVGHKVEAMRKHKFVCLQIDQVVSIRNWRSVLVHGDFEELEGSTAKKYLRKFAEGVRTTFIRKEGSAPQYIHDFSSRLNQRGAPIVYRINIKDISGKYRDGK